MPITPNNTIAELLGAHPAAAGVLVRYRMHCVGCDIAQFETIEDACGIYGVPIEEFFGAIERATTAKEEDA
jgi:hybrid cluster-associated redox disulfide protein